ncbi:cysteine--tRNA ligase [Candidatus Gracilibacteria bacterium]|nr:cysteine--tRNA ligase [Candidatus Gracilibacteria bacterium]
MISFYNTLTSKKEVFRPIKGKFVGLYTCGPTVYLYAHIGNYRTYIFEDILKRVLRFEGYEVKHVMNITDVGHLSDDADYGEDKVELSAKTQNKTAWELAEFYTDAFLKDLGKLNVENPDIMPKATDHIKEQIELVQLLERKGFTYKTDDGIYFDVEKFDDYGKLSKQKLEDKQAGARVEVNMDKHNPADFALWKFTAPGVKRQMEWDSPWGLKGFPGWHIECSAMSTKYLGQPFDIHCGGIDHIPVHHENEIAQSEAAHGKPLANFWMHGEFMMVEGRRMGKSEGNAYLVSDLETKGFDALAYRYLCLNTHYRIQLNFTWDALIGAQKALERLREQVHEFSVATIGEQGKVLGDFRKDFCDAIDDDLNLPQALGIAWTMLKSNHQPEDKLATIMEFDKVLGLNLAQSEKAGSTATVQVPDEVMELVSKREIARAEKNYGESDLLRKRITELGYEVEDTPNGPKVKKLLKA